MTQQFADSYCRKCGGKNHIVFFAPVFVSGIDARNGAKHDIGIGSHVCFECAETRNWIDRKTGNLKQGVQL